METSGYFKALSLYQAHRTAVMAAAEDLATAAANIKYSNLDLDEETARARSALADLEKLGQKSLTFFAVCSISENRAWVVAAIGPAWPANGGWTYQQIAGFGGTILCESQEPETAKKACDEFVASPVVSRW